MSIFKIGPLRFSTFMRRISKCNLSEHNEIFFDERNYATDGNNLYFQEGAQDRKDNTKTEGTEHCEKWQLGLCQHMLAFPSC